MSTRSSANSETLWSDVDDDVALDRYQRLVDTITDGIFQLDSDGNFVAVTDLIVEMTGYGREELLDEHVSLVLDTGDIERIEREISSQIELETDSVAVFEIDVKNTNGETFRCELRTSLLIEEGDFQGTLGVARDISETKQRPTPFESARAPDDSVAGVLDEANIGVIVLDDEFEVSWADETICQYLGLDREDFIGSDKRRLIDETVKDRFDDPERFSEKVLATYDDNTYLEQFECHVTAVDGREGRWLEHHSKPIESGQYAGGRIELYYDITDRKQSEGALQETEEQFTSLVDAVEEYAIFRLDPDGHVISWNEGAMEIKGYDPDEILGEHFSTFYTVDDQAAGVPDQNLERATEAGSFDDEGWRVRKDGSQFWANVTITAVRGEDGTHRGYLKVTRDMTDRYERKQVLESELERILGRISDAFYAVDDEWRFTHVNERMVELVGMSEEELLGENVWEVFPETVDTRIYELDHRAMETGEPVSYEAYYESWGTWYEANVYPSETGMSVYFRDVTERKEREHELERYEKTIETIWDGVATLDDDDRFVMVNEAFCEMTGYDRDDLLGEHVTLIHDEAVNERADEMNTDVLTGDREYASLEFELETATGETISVEGRFGPYELEDGMTGRTGVIRDVTERRERERELEQRARQQRVVADLGQFALESDDLDELMQEAVRNVADVLDNEYCKVLDLDDETEELLLRQGVGWMDGLVGKATVSAVEANSQAAYTLENDHPIVVEDLETETRFSGPELLRSHDVHSGISTIIGPFDEPWGVLGTHDTDCRAVTDEDVTFVQSVANVLAEAIERHRYQEELEQLVTDLEESNERLEQFAYAASHDLQEPLRMVSSYLQLIERRADDELSEETREFLEYAVDGADRMRAMIDGLLQYSRVEAQGKLLEPIDLDAVIEDVRDDLNVQITERAATVTIEELPRVEGDEHQLRQVFQNLLRNALEYSGEEPPQVHISAEWNGTAWTVSVQDEGIGIDPAEQKRIFEIFQRLHSQRNHTGSGIGLALCDRIVERHGGELWVDSEPGEGATFSFTLSPAERKDD